ncbi:MAG: transcription termination factor Rho [Nocardioides sp.]|nr:transcription termination factor Rho [Nocardioides sp.]
MTETPSASASAPAKKRGGGLNSMLLADLKSMAAGLAIAGAGSMKKAQLVDAIKASQAPAAQAPATQAPATQAPAAQAPKVERTTRAERAARSARVEVADPPPEQDDRTGDKTDDKPQDRQDQKQGQQSKQQRQRQPKQSKQPQPQDNQRQEQPEQQREQAQPQPDKQQAQQNQAQQNQSQVDDGDDDGEGGSRRNRRRRGRDRERERERTPVRTGARNEPDTTILEDDVLVPAAGILDVLDNCAFVRTSGYLPGPEDVYLSLSMVRKYHLRRGDAVVGQVRQPREGERREKFNPMVRIDSINGTDAEGAKDRPDFSDALPVHPHQRLRLATDDANLIGRVVDIATPIGKGQRGLIMAPPRTGATSLLQSIATSVTTNNPECHVMVVLVDTRPEEVTDFQRAVKGEVVASTFDRQPADHTVVAELAIERAKRLVELGHDVVVLLDSLTRLGRAYNLAAPANGRVLGGVVDACAVHPTKEFFGAARKIEDGGSLTILATVTVDTHSATDEFFLEELSGTANLELRLSADRAAKGLVPAIDVAASRTRHEEKLLAPAEGAVVGDLRKQLAAADSPQAVSKVFGARSSAR